MKDGAVPQVASRSQLVEEGMGGVVGAFRLRPTDYAVTCRHLGLLTAYGRRDPTSRASGRRPAVPLSGLALSFRLWVTGQYRVSHVAKCVAAYEC